MQEANKKRTRLLLIVGAILVVIAVIISIIFACSYMDKKNYVDSSIASADEAVELFTDKQGDLETQIKLLTQLEAFAEDYNADKDIDNQYKDKLSKSINDSQKSVLDSFNSKYEEAIKSFDKDAASNDIESLNTIIKNYKDKAKLAEFVKSLDSLNNIIGADNVKNAMEYENVSINVKGVKDSYISLNNNIASNIENANNRIKAIEKAEAEAAAKKKAEEEAKAKAKKEAEEKAKREAELAAQQEADNSSNNSNNNNYNSNSGSSNNNSGGSNSSSNNNYWESDGYYTHTWTDGETGKTSYFNDYTGEAWNDDGEYWNFHDIRGDEPGVTW